MAFYFWILMIIVSIVCVSGVELSYQFARLTGRPLDGRAQHKWAVRWGRSAFRFMPGWNIEVSGREYLPESNTATMIVANHESMTDILAMYFLGTQFRWLSKMEVKKVPLIGRAMTLLGYVFINRGNKQSHEQAMQECRDILDSGVSMFFFPEGTRSVDGRIKNFKYGAFKLAKEANVDIQPIVIKGAGKLMQKGGKLPGRTTVKVQVLPQIPIGTKESFEDLAVYTREKIVEAHEKII